MRRLSHALPLPPPPLSPGRAPFIPLDRVRGGNPQYPTHWGQDVMPLTKYVKPKDARVGEVIKQVGPGQGAGAGQGRAGRGLKAIRLCLAVLA
jgi:hypothetical protein